MVKAPKNGSMSKKVAATKMNKKSVFSPGPKQGGGMSVGKTPKARKQS